VRQVSIPQLLILLISLLKEAEEKDHACRPVSAFLLSHSKKERQANKRICNRGMKAK
jgi:hypothetical protein